jgi:hypothetical protein
MKAVRTTIPVVYRLLVSASEMALDRQVDVAEKVGVEFE